MKGPQASFPRAAASSLPSRRWPAACRPSLARSRVPESRLPVRAQQRRFGHLRLQGAAHVHGYIQHAPEGGVARHRPVANGTPPDRSDSSAAGLRPDHPARRAPASSTPSTALCSPAAMNCNTCASRRVMLEPGKRAPRRDGQRHSTSKFDPMALRTMYCPPRCTAARSPGTAGRGWRRWCRPWFARPGKVSRCRGCRCRWTALPPPRNGCHRPTMQPLRSHRSTAPMSRSARSRSR